LTYCRTVRRVGGQPGEASLSVKRTDRESCILLVVRGDLDLATEGKLLAAAWAVLRERGGRPLVLDLSGLAFVGSVGFSELLMIDHEATTHGQELRMVTGGNQRLRILLGSLGPLQRYDSVDKACEVAGTTTSA
jgi:anti-anti-sigma factor